MEKLERWQGKLWRAVFNTSGLNAIKVSLDDIIGNRKIKACNATREISQ